MTMPDQHTTTPTTVESAIANATRLLHHAEGETNLPLTERLEHLADTWLAIAIFLNERDRV